MYAMNNNNKINKIQINNRMQIHVSLSDKTNKVCFKIINNKFKSIIQNKFNNKLINKQIKKKKSSQQRMLLMSIIAKVIVVLKIKKFKIIKKKIAKTKNNHKKTQIFHSYNNKTKFK